MNDTPLPLIVCASKSFGWSTSEWKSSNASRSRTWSWPSQTSTYQPKRRTFSSRSPSARISSVGLSDWSSLRSTITIRLPIASCAPACSASQF